MLCVGFRRIVFETLCVRCIYVVCTLCNDIERFLIGNEGVPTWVRIQVSHLFQEPIWKFSKRGYAQMSGHYANFHFVHVHGSPHPADHFAFQIAIPIKYSGGFISGNCDTFKAL